MKFMFEHTMVHHTLVPLCREEVLCILSYLHGIGDCVEVES